MSRIKIIFKQLFLLLIISIFFVMPAEADNSPDAISIRVMSNTENLSPLAWYLRNIEIQGSPQELKVDGYEAVRDGRTVYVNAANVDGSSLYTNIYAISYNRDAENATVDIFTQIIKNWRFNTNLTTEGTCMPLGIIPCLTNNDCSNGEYCNSEKAKVTRDTIRLSDLYEINLAIKKYINDYSEFPSLPDGTYLPNKTISTWGLSWNKTFGAKLGYALPLDPINKMGKCKVNDAENAKFDPANCWNEKDKEFSTDFSNPVLPIGTFAYLYLLEKPLSRYKLCTNFETNYDTLPDQHRCDNFIQQINNTPPEIIFGTLNSEEGKYEGYFSVKSFYDIDWGKTKIIPLNPSTWSGWTGWQWNDLNKPGLQLQNTIVDNQKKLSARAVNLNGQIYADFGFKVEVTDKLGNVGQNSAMIRICNELQCKETTITRCGSVPKQCSGGYLACGACPVGQNCTNNVCQ
ncbi:MAG: hypothetical protein V1865_01375 [bacterium]